MFDFRVNLRGRAVSAVVKIFWMDELILRKCAKMIAHLWDEVVLWRQKKTFQFVLTGMDGDTKMLTMCPELFFTSVYILGL